MTTSLWNSLNSVSHLKTNVKTSTANSDFTINNHIFELQTKGQAN